MPFTPTHILAILPFTALRFLHLPFVALAIGSMIPDLPLFVRVWPGYQVTHSIPGLITGCLPLGIAAYLTFRILMERPLLALLPEEARSRLEFAIGEHRTISIIEIALASVAIVIGSATHVFWDSFTHIGRWGTQVVPALNKTEFSIYGKEIQRFELLQYGCTFVGLPLLAAIGYRWYRNQPAAGAVHRADSLSSTVRATICAMILAFSCTVAVIVWFEYRLPIGQRLHLTVTTSGLAFMVSVLVYCLAFQLIFRPRKLSSR